jgi:signal transduction histidine kinase
MTLRRHPHGDKNEIARTIRWVALMSLLLFLTLIVAYLLIGDRRNALASGIGIIPIGLSLLWLRRGAVALPSAVLAVTIILLITWLATFGQGIHDIGVMGYPVILIVAGLILHGRVIQYLTLLIIACLGWLVFGELAGWHQPLGYEASQPQDFFIVSVIILIAGNAISRLVRNVYQNLEQAESEITVRKRAEAEREKLIQRLRAKNQELDRFALRVSHDLKTPLITIGGYLGYLDMDIKSGNHVRAEKDLTQIGEAARSMGRFVDELLDLSRVGRIVNPPTEASFEEIVQEALKAAEGLIQARQVRVEVEAGLPSVLVDRARIVQVVQNLITNAVKFMGDQPHPMIRIGFEEKGGEPVFYVSDNGIGIAPEQHEAIFELFIKLDPDIEGTGIGLGLVKKIIEVHHGRIWVESEPGKGAAFKFTLGNPPQRQG